MIDSAATAKVFVAIVILAGLITACAHAPEETRSEPASIPSAPSARDVLEAGYATIADRYIERVSIETVAMNGIEGLRTLDPGLTVRRQGNILILSVGGNTILRQALPRPDDAKEWADLTVRTWAAGRENTRGLAAADAEQVYEAVFDASLAALDQFSKYASAKEARANRLRRYGRGGIGVSFELQGGMARVTKVRVRGPAANAGLRAGDWVTHIDEIAVAGLSQSDVSERLGGPAGTWMTLTVRRSPTRVPRRLRVHREHIVSETVAVARGDGIIYVGVKGFNGGTAGRIWSVLHEATQGPSQRVRGVILDLRGNPGGLLHQSVKVADLFLDRGPVIATQGRHPHSIQSYEASGPDILAALPMVVLIDGGSASAAEIVAAALQDRGRALVVGTASYGKDTVQTIVALPNDGELVLTWSRLVTPSGRVLQGRGVVPTICTSGVGEGGIYHLGPSTRVSCPPQTRETSAEIEIARRVLDDWSMYSALIDPGGPAQALY